MLALAAASVARHSPRTRFVARRGRFRRFTSAERPERHEHPENHASRERYATGRDSGNAHDPSTTSARGRYSRTT
ncbi:hypothetical protein GCM10022282_06920 [Agromyces indicus]